MTTEFISNSLSFNMLFIVELMLCLEVAKSYASCDWFNHTEPSRANNDTFILPSPDSYSIISSFIFNVYLKLLPITHSVFYYFYNYRNFVSSKQDWIYIKLFSNNIAVDPQLVFFANLSSWPYLNENIKKRFSMSVAN